MNLTDAQAGALNIAFRVADEQGLLLLDLKDLQAMLTFVADSAATLTTRYGNVTKATVGAIQRRSEEHTSELQSLMRISYAVFCLKKKKKKKRKVVQTKDNM